MCWLVRHVILSGSEHASKMNMIENRKHTIALFILVLDQKILDLGIFLDGEI